MEAETKTETKWLRFAWKRTPWTGADLIREVVDELEKGKLAESFHFFYEHEVELRVEVDEGRAEETVKVVNDYFQKRGGTAPQQKEYDGEEGLYGERGWPIVKKFFEYSSRIALEKDQPDKDRNVENGFADHKLVHCYLNQQGMSILDEATFHKERYWERLSWASRLIPPPPTQ